jgi:hypothetical protein
MVYGSWLVGVNTEYLPRSTVVLKAVTLTGHGIDRYMHTDQATMFNDLGQGLIIWERSVTLSLLIGKLSIDYCVDGLVNLIVRCAIDNLENSGSV